MSRTVLIIQARMTSTRLPGKVMRPVVGKPAILHFLDRVRRIEGLDDICVCIPEGDAHQPLVEVVSGERDIIITRGPELDVLRRYVIAARETEAEKVVRITSDCCFIDPPFSSALLKAWSITGMPCARTAFNGGVPYGFDTEGVPASALFAADAESQDPYDREHVTPFVWKNRDRFPTLFLNREPDRSHWRLTLDTPQDYQFLTTVYERLYHQNPNFGFDELEALFKAEPELLAINALPKP